MHDLPFSYVENERVWIVNRVLNLDFKPISRNTAKVDCWNVFLSEKTKIKCKTRENFKFSEKCQKQ